MAQRVAVEVLCDIDGTPGADTVSFGLDGVAYDIDLSGGHADTLRAELAPYVAAARRTGGRRVRGTGATSPAGPSTPRNPKAGEIRAWAEKRGIPVSPRGRIKQDIVEQYEEAQREPAPLTAAKPARRRKVAAK